MPRHYLVVDDSPVIRQTLVKMLERLSSDKPEISAAERSEEALEIFRRDEPDVVFMDIRLPDADGEQTARVMFEEDPETEIIIVTGLMEEDEQVREFISMGAFELLQKPIHSSDVEEVIQLLDQEQGGAGRIH